MSWFGDVCSSIGRAVSSAAKSVGRVASSALSKAKEVAGKAIGWMAEKAEAFVDGVKNVWKTVRPFVDQIRAGLQAAAKAVPIPWLSTALTLLDKVL